MSEGGSKDCNHSIGVEDIGTGVNSVVTIDDVYRILKIQYEIKLIEIFKYCPKCGVKLNDI